MGRMACLTFEARKPNHGSCLDFIYPDRQAPHPPVQAQVTPSFLTLFSSLSNFKRFSGLNFLSLGWFFKTARSWSFVIITSWSSGTMSFTYPTAHLKSLVRMKTNLMIWAYSKRPLAECTHSAERTLTSYPPPEFCQIHPQILLHSLS